MTRNEKIGHLSETRTKIAMEWKIDNYFSNADDSEFLCPAFFVSDSLFQIVLCTSPFLSVSLIKKDPKPTNIVEIAFGIKTANGSVENKTSNVWYNTSLSLECSKFFKRSELKYQKLKLVPSGILTITCILKTNKSFPEKNSWKRSLTPGGDNEIGELSEVSRKVEFLWTIDSIFSNLQPGVSFWSPEFPFSNSKWQMKIWLNSSASDEIFILLGKKGTSLPDNSQSKVYEFEIGIKAAHGNIQNNCKYMWTYENNVCFKLVKMERLNEDKPHFVPNCTLKIRCAFKAKDCVPDIAASKHELVSDLKNMFLSESLSDLTLKVKNVTFPTHKVILSGRSPVFAAMFQTEMLEQETDTVNISDCDPQVFKDFLFYLYSGELDFSKCKISDVYNIADKYDVPDLKFACVDFLAHNLCIENMFGSYILGNHFNEITLMGQVQTFFNENFKTIVCSEEWNIFMKEYTELANDLLKKMAENMEIEVKAYVI